MKNFKLNKKRICLLILTGFILINNSGCGKIEEKIYDIESFTVENYADNQSNIKLNENTVEKNKYNEIESNNQLDNTENVDNKTSPNAYIINDNESQYSEEDNLIINEFNSIKNKVGEFLNSEEVDIAKDKAKGVFISIVDFLFYDGEIKGIKFDDLTDEGKKKILEIITDIDNLVMKKFPTYKEDISSTTKNAYVKASELIKQGVNNIKDFSKEKLGEDNYNSIKDAKDDLVEYTKDAFEVIGNFSSNIWNSAKEKIKSWYEEFRNR